MFTVEKKGENLIITMPLQSPTPSASGKTRVVATTHGNVPTQITIGDKPIIVGVNAYIRN